jgi:hypothetical protein
MLISQHAIAGAVVAVSIGNPVLGFIGAYLSHHVLDLLPHIDNIPLEDRLRKKDVWSRETWILAIVDGIVGLLIIAYLIWRKDQWLLVGLGAFGGILVDLFDNVPFWKKTFRSTKFGAFFHSIHSLLHFSWKQPTLFKIFITIMLQLAIVGGGIWYLLRSF